MQRLSIGEDDVSGTKKRVRVALVGISPADQVTIRGYLRVLLALDYELVWIPATEFDIDLFIINNEFHSAKSVSKLLENNPNTSVLYVRSSQDAEGGIIQNILTLPLKKIGLLEEWLLKSVPVLSKNNTASYKQKPYESVVAATTVAQPLSEVQDLTKIIATIKQLQQREPGLVELMEQDKVVAIIDKKHQKLWQLGSISKISLELYLRPYYGEPPSDKFVDSSNWLWQLALHQGDVLANLIEHNNLYQLQYWVKPLSGSARRDALQVMTAIESGPLTIGSIAQRTGVSVSTVKKIVASLLFSGNLTNNAYINLKHTEDFTINNQHSAHLEQPKVQPQQSSPQAEQSKPQQEEKLGFLSRLRRKLGL